MRFIWGLWANWLLSLQGHFLSSLKGHCEQRRAVLPGKAKLHPSAQKGKEKDTEMNLTSAHQLSKFCTRDHVRLTNEKSIGRNCQLHWPRD